MTKPQKTKRTKHATGFAARGYTEADLAEIRDFPDPTDTQLARARPFDEVLPAQAAAIRRLRGPQKAPKKVAISLRVDPDVLEGFKASGHGWQGRMNEALRKALQRSPT